jgi:hypothetical protein
MEVRNSPSERPIEEMATKQMIEDLCSALRSVALSQMYDLGPNPRIVAAIQQAQKIHGELSRRGAKFENRLQLLSEQTNWRMEELLADVLRWPDLTPRVREKDGILRFRRCSICGAREFPDPGEITYCDACLDRVIEAISTLTPFEGLLLYRTYTASYWCLHADANTVLATADSYDLPSNSRCIQCLADELDRRRADSVQPGSATQRKPPSNSDAA